MQKFEIIMLGNAGVGKTSLLSAIKHELESYNLDRSVQLNPSLREGKILDDQWSEMLQRIKSRKAFTTLTDGLEGNSQDFVEHEFDFTVGGHLESKVVFTDTKGGMTGDSDKKIIKRVNEAFGVFCAIDASVLMECPTLINNGWNCPDKVKDILDKVYNDGDDKQPRCVVFLLTKCEKYMATEDGRNALKRTFHKHYDIIIDMLHKAPHPPNIYMIAIQTMPCVRFYKLNLETRRPMFRVLPKKELVTKDCAYPLVILLRNIIETKLAGQGAWERMLVRIGWIPNLKEYLNHLKAHVKRPDLAEDL